MKFQDKYKKIFIKSLSIKPKSFNDKIAYNEIPEWDSIAHMTLISALEEGFKISIDTDDVINFSSFKKGAQILEKYISK